jgi:hypothetical protein
MEQVLETAAGDALYRKVVTKPFDWAAILESRPGQELTPEEYDERTRTGRINLSTRKASLNDFCAW